MRNRHFILLIFLLQWVFASSQSVISTSALSSQTNRRSTTIGSTGSQSGIYTSSAISIGSQYQSAQAQQFNATQARSFSPSNSAYSSQIATPFSSNGSSPIRRTDYDEDDEEPWIHPGDPGDPIPLGEGIMILLLLAVAYFTYRRINDIINKINRK